MHFVAAWSFGIFFVNDP